MALRVVCTCWLVTAAATWCSLLLTSNYLLSLQSFRDELLTAPNPPPSPLQGADPPPLAGDAAEQPRRLVGSTPNCTGRYIYMYDLPPRFNQELLEQCSRLSIWTNMCPHVSNAGLGKPIRFRNFSSGWYATNQFTAELIFHERMKRYECLTGNWASATAFYVPFYGGFEMSRYVDHQNTSLRDELGLELGRWLENRVEWKQQLNYEHRLKNHFMVLGRITWDFMRGENNNRDWGNNLLAQPFTKRMLVLLVEAHPWHQNEFGVPYPTYFHPSSASELETWQRELRLIKRSMKRGRRIAFVGGAKPGNALRGEVMSQCRSSPHCRMLDCSSSGSADCHDPVDVMRLLLDSTFCLQPRGDSFTRRSVFDSLIAVCIPVVFSEHSMSSQYQWNMRAEECSVLIPEEEVLSDSRAIEERLLRIPDEDVDRMQERLIEMLPLVTYGDPRGRGTPGFTDAFGAMVEGIIARVRADQESVASLAVVSKRTRRKRRRNKRLDKKQTSRAGRLELSN